MPSPRRMNPIARRRPRRTDEDGESSTAGDVDEISISEGSVISNIDDEVEIDNSDLSVADDETLAPQPTTDSATSHTTKGVSQDAGQERNEDLVATTKIEGFKTTPDTIAMMEGLKAGATDEHETVHFDDAEVQNATADGPTVNADPKPQHETPAQKGRREHLEYIKQRNTNPAFVPNRGGFFLHDDRGTTHTSAFGRPYTRGRGRGYHAGHNTGREYTGPAGQLADQPWAHDLHDAVNKSATSITPTRPNPISTQIPTAKAASVAPNRSFSVTTVLGNINIQISMPGMDDKKTVTSVVKKQHTFLPEHRPPLRRDKPVRISIPDEHARYIFPSAERSFIFIPRALRPNQQGYSRMRGGKPSFQGSRRGSVLGGSTYSPSVGMSRKSSVSLTPGLNGFQTPIDTAFRDVPYLQNGARPIVRMPAGGYPVPLHQYTPQRRPSDTSFIPETGFPGPAILHSPSVAIPMHQPRPQKTVSVMGIESPAVKAPQQQQEQPFHQQMPAGVGLTQTQSQASTSVGASLSHIPEGAVYAQPFQPYPMFQPGFFGVQYAGNPIFFPPATDSMGYGMTGIMAPSFVPGMHLSSYGGQAPVQDGMGNMVGHESNGMVFYYDQGQATGDGTNQYSATTNGMAMLPTAPYLYPPVPSGVHYAAAGQ